MSTLEEVILVNSVLALLLAALVSIVTRFWRNPYVAYALWLLVIAKLITPPLVPLYVGEFVSSNQAAPAPVEVMPPTETWVASRKPSSSIDHDTKPAAAVVPAVDHVARHESARASNDNNPFDLAAIAMTLAAAIWLTGAACVLAKLTRERRQVRRIIRLARPVGSKLEADIARICRRVGLSRIPEARLVDATISPMVWVGDWRPVLLLPRGLVEDLSPSQRDLVIAHEVVHLKRRDHVVRRFQLAITCVYWWHPVVWFANRRIQCVADECCDATVLSIFRDQSQNYASALLDCVDFLSDDTRVAFASGTRFLSTNNLKARLSMIVKEQLDYRFGWTTKVSLAVAAALVLPLSAELRSSRAETATQRTNGEHGTGADLVGKWTVTACTFGGQPDPSAIGDVHTILNDRMIRPNRRTQYGYNVDEEGEINLTAPRLGDEHLRGIYALDGDTLRICYAYEPEMRRPSEFVSPQGKRVYLYEYKRHASESDGSLAISPRGPAVEPDLTGEWRITAATYGGRANPSLVGSIHTILSDRMIRPGLRTQYGYNVVEKGEINLTAPRLGDKHLRGIYALDGDTLRICYAYEPEMRRPSKFVSPAGRRIYLYEYQRVSDESRPRATARTAARPTARWARLSPFTHVQCLEGDNVAVTFGNSNYELVSIDGLPTADILRSARKQFGGLWEKRFVEDLVEVLAGMGHPPADSVALVLREPKSGVLRKVPRAPLTRDNRMQVYRSRYRTSSDQTETSLLQKMATNPESTEREKLAALRRLRFATTPEGDARTHEVIVAMIALAKATKDSSIRADVFRQLDGVTDPVLENVLLDALANDPNASVRSEAAETLAQYRSSRVTAALASAEDGDESPDVRAEARRSLDER